MKKIKIKIIQEFVAKEITNAINICEIYDWKDNDLCKLFQDDFKGYIKDNF